MPVAEVGKIYEYNGKKYVAQKPKGEMSCVGCSLALLIRCPKMMRNGVYYSCVDEKEENDVIFVEVKEK